MIGKNGTGKTFLLKALYVAIKTAEEYHRGDDVRSVNEILAEKLRWTYQMQNLGDLVTKSTSDRLKFSVKCKNFVFCKICRGAYFNIRTIVMYFGIIADFYYGTF